MPNLTPLATSLFVALCCSVAFGTSCPAQTLFPGTPVTVGPGTENVWTSFSVDSLQPIAWNAIGISSRANYDLRVGGIESNWQGEQCDFVVADLNSPGSPSTTPAEWRARETTTAPATLQHAAYESRRLDGPGPWTFMPTSPSGSIIQVTEFLPRDEGKYYVTMTGSPGVNWFHFAPDGFSSWRSRDSYDATGGLGTSHFDVSSSLANMWHVLVFAKDGGRSLGRPTVTISRSPPPVEMQVTGVFQYTHPLLPLDVPIRLAKVELFDPLVSASTPVRTSSTSQSGTFQFDYELTSPRSLTVRIQASTPAGACANNLGIYRYDFTQTYDPADPSTWAIDPSITTFTASLPPTSEIWYALDSELRAFEWLVSHPGVSTPSPVTIFLPVLFTGPQFRPLFNRIELPSISIPGNPVAWSEDVVYHEYGHALMHNEFGGFPADPGNFPCLGGQHELRTLSNPCFALMEGWAEFFQSGVAGTLSSLLAATCATSTLCQPQGTGDVETNDWWKGENCTTSTHSGVISEGAVASILWDIYDDNSLLPSCSLPDDDSLSHGLHNSTGSIWRVMETFQPNSITEFFEGWNSLGYADVDELSSVFLTHGVPSLQASDAIIGQPLEYLVTAQPSSTFILAISLVPASRPGFLAWPFEGGLLLNTIPYLESRTLGASSSSAMTIFSIPNNPLFVGLTLHAQVLVGPDLLGLNGTFTNRVSSTIGNL